MALALNDKLARNENNLAGKIHSTTINRSVWNKLVPKEEWTDGISDEQDVLTVERNLPANIDSWTSIKDPNNGTTNNCAQEADIVPRGHTTRRYSLVQKAVESDRICVNDTRNAYKVNEQISAAFKNLRNTVAYTWKRRAQLEYTRVSENKVVAASGLPYDSTDFPGIAATSTLTQKILDIYYDYLITNSAEEDGGSLGMFDGSPQFIVVTDRKTADDIRNEDNARNAQLWNSDRVPDLLKAMGVGKPFRGFFYTIDNLPRRYTFASGVYTEVLPYSTVAASTGTKSKLSPEYMAAPFQDSTIFLPSVMCFKHPRPISSVGSGTSFVPQTYVGDFKWKNVENVDSTSPYYNPDGEWGFYRAKMMSATRPGAPQFGIVIRHLRCPGDIGAQACPAEFNDGVGPSDLGAGDSFFV
jgi:hypothetical protein